VPQDISARLIVDSPLTVTDQLGVVPSRVPSRPIVLNGLVFSPNSAATTINVAIP